MYDFRPNLIIGFHGCDQKVRDKLLNNPNEVVISQKPYDWLGHGMYFWENNYQRALVWAEDKRSRGTIGTPAVLGAVLYLGYCCDLMDSKNIGLLAGAHKQLVKEFEAKNLSLPKNIDSPHDQHKDKILRYLDCHVIEYMHKRIQRKVRYDILQKGFSETRIFDSARGTFSEGGPAFQGSGIQAKTHTQICIRNLNCIQGFFLPRKTIDFDNWLDTRHPRIAA